MAIRSYPYLLQDSNLQLHLLLTLPPFVSRTLGCGLLLPGIGDHLPQLSVKFGLHLQAAWAQPKHQWRDAVWVDKTHATMAEPDVTAVAGLCERGERGKR